MAGYRKAREWIVGMMAALGACAGAARGEGLDRTLWVVAEPAGVERVMRLAADVQDVRSYVELAAPDGRTPRPIPTGPPLAIYDASREEPTAELWVERLAHQGFVVRRVPEARPDGQAPELARLLALHGELCSLFPGERRVLERNLRRELARMRFRGGAASAP